MLVMVVFAAVKERSDRVIFSTCEIFGFESLHNDRLVSYHASSLYDRQ